MAKRVYERLFCCECSCEVPPGESGLASPALQSNPIGAGGSARPHVWCKRCAGVLEEETEALPKPHELHGKPEYQLHTFIWSVGEGRTMEELLAFYRACRWPGVTLASLLRELTEAGKIEQRGNRRVALCTPWAELQPPPPRFQPTDRLHIDGVCYEVRKVFSPTELLVELVWGRADSGSMARAEYLGDDRWEITEEFTSDTEGLPEPLYKKAPPRPAGNVVPSLRKLRKAPREDDYEDPAVRDAEEALPDEDELQSDRYIVDDIVDGPVTVVLQALYERIRNIEAQLSHLVIMDNEQDVGSRLERVEKLLLKLARVDDGE